MSKTILPVKVGLFKTADSLDAAMTELKANLPITDPNVLHGLVMQYHNTLIKEMLNSNVGFK